jgi:hypothetical protein
MPLGGLQHPLGRFAEKDLGHIDIRIKEDLHEG